MPIIPDALGRDADDDAMFRLLLRFYAVSAFAGKRPGVCSLCNAPIPYEDAQPPWIWEGEGHIVTRVDWYCKRCDRLQEIWSAPYPLNCKRHRREDNPDVPRWGGPYRTHGQTLRVA